MFAFSLSRIAVRFPPEYRGTASASQAR